MENVRGLSFNALKKRLLADQQPLLLSVALHLIPGGLILAAYRLITAPLVQALGFPPYLAWVMAMVLALAPAELGLLFYLGWKQNGKPSLRGVVCYTEKPVKRGALIGLVITLCIWVLIASVLLTPVDTLVYSYLFSWIPFEITAGSNGFLSGYSRSTVVVTLATSLVLTGIILPAIEELYFRGYLLPRLSRLGRWAPVLNILLFSLYHFWTPWQFFSRIGFFLPTVWFTYRKQDLRISLWVHCLSNNLVQLLAFITIVLG